MLTAHQGQLNARTLYSPYGPACIDDLHIPPSLLRKFLRMQFARLDQPPVANSVTEAHILSRITGRSADLIEYPVERQFFDTPRRVGRTPIIVTVADAADERSVDLYTRLAILLNFEDPPLRFSWIGQVSSDARAKLRAANVRVFETADASDTARYLSQAWVFVQTVAAEELPTNVARAMAMGLPCLTSDTQAHRDLILHGETGFICTSERDFIERIATMVSNEAERMRVGDAARAEAKRRFTGGHFRTSLLRLYGFEDTVAQSMSFNELRAGQ